MEPRGAPLCAITSRKPVPLYPWRRNNSSALINIRSRLLLTTDTSGCSARTMSHDDRHTLARSSGKVGPPSANSDDRPLAFYGLNDVGGDPTAARFHFAGFPACAGAGNYGRPDERARTE